MNTIPLPETEYPSRYGNYTRTVNETELMEALKNTERELLDFIGTLPDDRLAYRYAEGKWNIAEVIQHITDTERLLGYRALRFARNDATGLLGFEQDDYVPFSGANERTKEELMADFRAARLNSISLFGTFTNEMLVRTGTTDGDLISVRALGFIISGHLRHHLRVLKERYI